MLEALHPLPSDPLLTLRQKARAHLAARDFPEEMFRYVPLKGLTFPAPAKRPSLSRGSAAPFRIVFIDGFFSPADSQIPAPLIALPLDKAIHSYAHFLQNRLQRLIKEEKDPFALLNVMWQEGGLFLYAPPQCVLEQPIYIEHYSTQEALASPCLMLYLGAAARLELVQSSESCLFSNSLFTAVLDSQSRLTFRDARGAAAGRHFQSIRISQKGSSSFQFHLFTDGSPLVRTSLCVQLLEEGSEALLQGLWMLRGERQSHIHATVEHRAPNTRSRQHFKGILYDASRSSFAGNIFVAPEAQKTESYQLNNNLLLSEEASAYAKPHLEILADDVKASHGATVAQLDAEDLFYLQARGLSPAEAKQMLVQGFIQELVHCLPGGGP